MAAPRLLHACIIMTLFCWFDSVKRCSGSIDEIIAGAMKSSASYGFMYDENSNTVRVDLDMIFSIEDWNKLISINDSYSRPPYHPLFKRQAIKNGVGAQLWPEAVIPYEINSYDFNYGDEQVFYAAMQDWMRYTCVRFIPAGPQHRNKIRFVDGDGCSSNVGMVRDTQKVTLGNGCRKKGVVIHELGHVLGFHHEQTRPDRDQYVRINYQNIARQMTYNFKKYTWAVIADLGVMYDYLSIMHYGPKSFSTNGRYTIETLQPMFQSLIGNRDGLSFRDIKSANRLYNCRSPNCFLSDNDCPGEGFVSKNCQCWCPSPKPYGDYPYVVCQPGGSPGVGMGLQGNNLGIIPNNGGNTGNGGGGGCLDQNPNCVLWKARGECDRQPFYMHSYCRRSCGLCGTVEPRCRDEYQAHMCLHWRGQGFCQAGSNFGSFMAYNCRKTCGFCQDYNGGYPYAMLMDSAEPVDSDGESTAADTSGTGSCKDDEPSEACRTWKNEGECEKSAEHMRVHCARTCDMCS